MQPSLGDIAKELNVSPSTISLVLHGKPGVGDATRARVLEQLREHGYLDNKPVVFNKSIYLLKYTTRYLSERSDEFVTAVIDSIEREARVSGIKVVMCACRDGELLKMLEMLGASPLDGMIVIGTELPLIYESYFDRVPFPVVLIDSSAPFCMLDSVTQENCQSIFAAAEHLYSLGHRSIGYLHSVFDTANNRERYEAYHLAMEHLGIRVDKRHICAFDLSVKHIYKNSMSGFKDLNACPTAFIAGNDTIALTCIRELNELGHRVPEDISIVGYDNVSFCKLSSPPLTTVAPPTELMGKHTVRMLHGRISMNSSPVCRLRLGGELVIRESTSVPRAHDAGF